MTILFYQMQDRHLFKLIGAFSEMRVTKISIIKNVYLLRNLNLGGASKYLFKCKSYAFNFSPRNQFYLIYMWSCLFKDFARSRLKIHLNELKCRPRE